MFLHNIMYIWQDNTHWNVVNGGSYTYMIIEYKFIFNEWRL